MLLQGTMIVGAGILFFGGLAMLIFSPALSILSYNAIEWVIMKSNSSITKLTGIRKILVIAGSVMLGIVLAFLLICLIFWLLLKDITFD